jgi:hypothetical protein
VPPPGSYYNYASFYNPGARSVYSGAEPATGNVTVAQETRADGRARSSRLGRSGDSGLEAGRDRLSVKSISAYREYDSYSPTTTTCRRWPIRWALAPGLPFFSQELRLNGALFETTAWSTRSVLTTSDQQLDLRHHAGPALLP